MRKLFALCLFTVSSGAWGKDPVLPSTLPADPVNKQVCQKIEEIGSRLKSHTVCMTRAQWDAQRRSDQDVIDRTQRQIGIQFGG